MNELVESRGAPVLLGYFPKQLIDPPEWMSERGIEEIASVSRCIAEGPDGWQDAWKHNELGFFANPETAWSVVAADKRRKYRLYAYALYPVAYRERVEEPMEVRAPEVTLLGPEYELVGYDVVSRTGSHFECSPLSCNMLANEILTNRYCLFSDLNGARELARSADEKRCEPGPYHVVQVWRERGRGKAS